MFTSVIRVLILYVIVLFVIRLMGKRQIGEMQPFELVITLIIADLATIPMSEHTLPLINGIVPVVTILLIHFVFCFIARKSVFFRRVLNGKAVIVINPDGVDNQALREMNMNMNDLQSALRNNGFLGPDEIQYAIIETNGQASFIPKFANSPATNEDLKIKGEEKELPVILISEGRLCKENIDIMKITEKEISKFVKEATKKTYNLTKICLFTLDRAGKVFFQAFGEKAISGKVQYKGEVQ